jgi:hypothetical protein
MASIADRRAEQRCALQEIQRQIEAGSLTVRNMTAEERNLYPPRPPETAPQVTRFFLGGMNGGGDVQAACDALRERWRIAIGCPGKSRRIFKLDCRFDGRNCEIDVGKPLPSAPGGRRQRGRGSLGALDGAGRESRGGTDRSGWEAHGDLLESRRTTQAEPERLSLRNGSLQLRMKLSMRASAGGGRARSLNTLLDKRAKARRANSDAAHSLEIEPQHITRPNRQPLRKLLGNRRRSQIGKA